MTNQTANKKLSVYDIVLVGLMAALVFVGTYLHLDVPTPMGKVMIHFGNVFCLLSGMLLGGVRGGLAAGIGSMFYDMMDPAYISECWITFINKFMMAFLCGIIVTYGVKKIAALREQADNGSLAKRTAAIKVLTGLGVLVLGGIGGWMIANMGNLFAAFSEGVTVDAVIKVIAAFLLIALMVVAVVFGVRSLFRPVQIEQGVSAKAAKIQFTTRLLGGIAGILGYLVLYLSKNFIMGVMQHQEMATIYATLWTKGSVSFINGIIAVVVSMILIPYFVMALRRSGMDRKIVAGQAK